MIGEIDEDFYCSISMLGQCDMDEDYCKKCDCKYNKWPTPEQFKEEYGHEYPDDAAVYVMYDTDDPAWKAVSYRDAKEMISLAAGGEIVCACSPWGRPPSDWRPP